MSVPPLAETGFAGQIVDVAAGGDVDPVSGRLLSVAQLQQALRLAAAMPALRPQIPAALPAVGSVEPAARAGAGQTGPQHRRGDGGLPTRDVAAGSVCVVGVSGGCGETVLAQLLAGQDGDRPVVAADHWWPAGDQRSVPVVLCARTTMASLTAAQQAAGQWAAGKVPAAQLLGLVLMADTPGREPRPVTDFARILAGGMPRLWRIGWVPAWRLGPPEPGALPRTVAAELADISAAVARCSSVPATTR